MSNIAISIVVGIANNNVIGMSGGMPWHLSSDLKRFKQITLGNPIIMGRKTYESIGRPLPGRLNIVITRNEGYGTEGIEIVGDLDVAIVRAQEWAAENSSREICIIGGGEIYRQALPQCDRLHVTHIDASPDGDTLFPEIDEKIWSKTHQKRHSFGEKDTAATRYVVYERK